MEESLKARLIGAVVLVALAVLLIPELLSGRKPAEPVVEEGAGPRGTRTFTIELGQAPGQASPGPVTSVAPLPAPSAPASSTAPAESDSEQAAPPKPSTEPAPEPAKVATTPPSTQPASVAKPQATQPTEPRPSTAASAAGGGWAVQVGAFGSTDAARKLQRDLSGAGFRVFVSPVSRGGKTLYRVRVGPVGDRAGAEQLVPRLKARGLPATVVQND